MNWERETMDNMPAGVTRDGIVPGKYHYWIGASGKRYLHTVFEFEKLPDIDNAVFLAVRRERNGDRTVLGAGALGTAPGHSRHASCLGEARRRGADEVHLHLTCETAAQRQGVLDDLTVRHPALRPERTAPAARASAR